MKLFLLVFLTFSCTLNLSSCTQLSILLSIKSSLIDPLGHLADWKTPQTNLTGTHCNWPGIRCNPRTEVEALDLSAKNLSGVIPGEIQGLSSLISLNLCCNAFALPLPESLSNLTSLRALDFSQNLFSGEFPILPAGLTSLNASGNSFPGRLPDVFGIGNSSTPLESLDLRGNFFSGKIPITYKQLQNLRFLGLSGNNLTGELPVELGELSLLETVILGYNNFLGGIPPEFGNLKNLKYLDLAIANLTGVIPGELGNLKKLETVFLYQNSLEGRIPVEIGGLPELRLLDLSENILSGEIPVEIAHLQNLRLLNLMSNRLSGSIPQAIENLTRLETLELWNNSFSGALPSNLGRNSPLRWLDVSTNSFSGPIPASLCRNNNLSKLILFDNALSSPIPDTLSKCDSLVRVRIHNNRFSGAIPVGFGSLRRLQRLELSGNNLTGPIPEDLAKSTSLSFIDLSRNHLQSHLPHSILSIPTLVNFLASGSELIGQIPDQFDCLNLVLLDLSSNNFSGSIPSSIASCKRLVTLKLQNNQLNGTIPRMIAKMPVLSVLDLSKNFLTGKIPEAFGSSPALESTNLSHNNLSGLVPVNGLLKTINPDDLSDNPGLCGGVLPPCDRDIVNTWRGLRVKHVVAGWIIGALTIIALVLTVLGGRFLYGKWRDGSCFEDRCKREWPWRLMAFQRLGFNRDDILSCVKESNVIGTGGTGTVYKAEIQRLKTAFAVKKLWRPSRKGDDMEMGNGNGNLVGEVSLLSKLRHRNIVRVVGFLYNDIDAMIIYEFMKNGDLGEALHGATRLLVDWVSRYNIAVGVAQGLSYLHHDCSPPVVHRDVKSSNVLLDENLDARLADFGLAKVMLRNNETVSIVAGSYGYIAPEYGYTMKVDEKSDVYSFGVVLMELVTGRKPVEAEFGESVEIVEWIRRKMRGKELEEALDSEIGTTKHVREEMLLVLRIAFLCTARLPKDRPSMRDVLTMLGEAKPRRKSSCNYGGGNGNCKNKPVFSVNGPM